MVTICVHLYIYTHIYIYECVHIYTVRLIDFRQNHLLAQRAEQTQGGFQMPERTRHEEQESGSAVGEPAKGKPILSWTAKIRLSTNRYEKRYAERKPANRSPSNPRSFQLFIFLSGAEFLPQQFENSASRSRRVPHVSCSTLTTTEHVYFRHLFKTYAYTYTGQGTKGDHTTAPPP